MMQDLRLRSLVDASSTRSTFGYRNFTLVRAGIRAITSVNMQVPTLTCDGVIDPFCEGGSTKSPEFPNLNARDLASVSHTL